MEVQLLCVFIAFYLLYIYWRKGVCLFGRKAAGAEGSSSCVTRMLLRQQKKNKILSPDLDKSNNILIGYT